MRACLVALAACALLAAGCGATEPMPARTAPAVGPEVPGVEHVLGTFEGVRGLTLFEQSWRPTGRVRAVLLIVHGLKDHSDRYARFASDLAQRGLAVYAFDLRGHGRSAGDRVTIDSFDDYLGDLDVFVHRVSWKEPGVPLFLFGHSMGGAIVTLYTLREKPAVAGLVLSAAALETDLFFGKKLATRALGVVFPSAPVFQLDLEDFSRDPAVVQDGKDDRFVYQDAAPARTARELLTAIAEIDQSMPNVTVPLLLLHGKADKVTPPQGSVDLNERAGSRDKTLILYDGLYHDLLHEPEHAKVEADITRWLLSHASRRLPRGA